MNKDELVEKVARIICKRNAYGTAQHKAGQEDMRERARAFVHSRAEGQRGRG